MCFFVLFVFNLEIFFLHRNHLLRLFERKGEVEGRLDPRVFWN